MSRRHAIGILEDDPLMRDYLLDTVNRDAAFEVAFCESTLARARASAKAFGHVDVCLVDLQLPDGNGMEFVRHARQAYGARSLILTVLGDKMSVLSAFESGADGYLLKDSEPEEITQHIRQIIKGSNPVSPQVSTHLLSLIRARDTETSPAEASPLTGREAEVLTLFAKGLTYREAAETLNVTINTVNQHVKSIYSKLQVRSRSEAVFEALQNRWIDM